MAGTNNLAPVFSAWLDSAMPDRQGMVLGKVESASCDAQGYRCSMRLLDTETLEETGDQLEDVPINNLQGFWSLPAVDSLVVVGFLGMDKGSPVVIGCYAGSPPPLQEKEILITQENGASLKLDEGGLVALESQNGKAISLAQENGASLKLDATGLIALKNQNESLKGILTALIDDLSSIKTEPVVNGKPASLSPDNSIKLKTYKGRIAALLSE